MDFIIAIFWWIVRIIGVLVAFSITMSILYVWSEHHKGGKIENFFNKILNTTETIVNTSNNLEKKLDQWDLKTNAQEGDLDSIYKFYGFKNNDVKSKEYAEILKVLDKAQSKNPYNKTGVKNLRDIVLYKILYDENAEQYLSAMTPKEADFIRNHRTFQKALNEGNIQEAQNTLIKLEGNDCLQIDQKLVGTLYYRIGMSYESGSGGYKKDIRKACEFYRKAALDFDVTSAMLPLGLLLISGEVHGIAINRDYITANTCVFLATKNGDVEAKKLSDEFGVGGIILRPIKESSITYNFLFGQKFTASVETIKYLHMMYGILSKAAILQKFFANDYSEKFKSFEQLVTGIDTLYINYIKQMLDFGIQTLMAYDIDEYDIDALIDASGGLSFSKYASDFIYSLDRVDSKAKQLNLDIEYAKATRARWVGGGMGTTIGGTIKASIKGSIAAGIMNAGTGVLYDIGGNIAKSKGNVEIQKMQENLFKSSHTKLELVNAVHSALFDIGISVLKILENHSIVGFYGLEGEIVYQGQDLSKIDDRALASKINNNQTSGNLEYLNALLLEKLRRDPFDQDTVEQLYRLSTPNKEVFSTLAQYAGDFGLKLSINP